MSYKKKVQIRNTVLWLILIRAFSYCLFCSRNVNPQNCMEFICINKNDISSCKTIYSNKWKFWKTLCTFHLLFFQVLKFARITICYVKRCHSAMTSNYHPINRPLVYRDFISKKWKYRETTNTQNLGATTKHFMKF